MNWINIAVGLFLIIIALFPWLESRGFMAKGKALDLLGAAGAIMMLGYGSLMIYTGVYHQDTHDPTPTKTYTNPIQAQVVKARSTAMLSERDLDHVITAVESNIDAKMDRVYMKYSDVIMTILLPTFGAFVILILPIYLKQNQSS